MIVKILVGLLVWLILGVIAAVWFHAINGGADG